MGITNFQLAALVPYDNTSSGLTATQVQAAIDELAAGGGGGGWSLTRNTIGGFVYGMRVSTADSLAFTSKDNEFLFLTVDQQVFNGSATIDSVIASKFTGTVFPKGYATLATSQMTGTPDTATSVNLSILDTNLYGADNVMSQLNFLYLDWTSITNDFPYAGLYPSISYDYFTTSVPSDPTRQIYQMYGNKIELQPKSNIYYATALDIKAEPVTDVSTPGQFYNVTGMNLNLNCAQVGSTPSGAVSSAARGINIQQVYANGQTGGAEAYGIYIGDTSCVADTGGLGPTTQYAIFNGDSGACVYSESKFLSPIGFDVSGSGSNPLTVQNGLTISGATIQFVINSVPVFQGQYTGQMLFGTTSGPDYDFQNYFYTNIYSGFFEFKDDLQSSNQLAATINAVMTLDNHTGSGGGSNYSYDNYAVVGTCNITQANTLNQTPGFGNSFGGGYFIFLDTLNPTCIFPGVFVTKSEIRTLGTVTDGSCFKAFATTITLGADEGTIQLIRGLDVDISTKLSGQSNTEAVDHVATGVYIGNVSATLSTTNNIAKGIHIPSGAIVATGSGTNLARGISVEDNVENYFEGVSTFKRGVKVKDTGAGSTTLDHYQEVAESDLGTLTWTAGAAPSGSINKKYKATRVGNRVDLWCRIEASTPGTTVTAVSFPLPSDTGISTPVAFTGMGNSEFNIPGSGSITVGGTLPTAGPGNSYLGKDSGGVWTVYINGPSSSADTAMAHICYFV